MQNAAMKGANLMDGSALGVLRGETVGHQGVWVIFKGVFLKNL